MAAAARSATEVTGESAGTASTTRMGLAVALEYCSSPSEVTVAPPLLDPVPAGDAEVEQAVGHVERDLLGAQDPHVVDPGIVDGGPVVDARTTGLTARSASANRSRVAFSSEPLGSTRRSTVSVLRR